MQNLFRRPSGRYYLRLTVPAQLRAVISKREIIATTGTNEHSVAKMVAGALATQWRQRFLDAERLLSQTNITTMPHQEILKIAQGHPILLAGGHLQLQHAAAASGISITDLLRAACNGRMGLYVRPGPVRGYLIPIDDLELDDPALGSEGGYIVPNVAQMPAGAVEHMSGASLSILAMDLPGITAHLMDSKAEIFPFSFEDPAHPGMMFVPNTKVAAGLGNLEVMAYDVELLRRSLSSLIDPERIQEAKQLQKAAMQVAPAASGAKSTVLLSESLDDYIASRVRQDVAGESEIARIRNGCALMIELEGDLRLGEVTAHTLRHFRDTHLARVPANENKIRLIHRTKSVKASMQQVAGTDWPVMSVAERNKRMRWISAWFNWLKIQGDISENLASAIHGESVQTRAERRRGKSVRREDEARDSFGEQDLDAIFSALWFKSGTGELTKKKTYRTFSPFYYWLPLLGLYTGGGRINELSQLHLDNIQQTTSGQWFVDFNDDAIDQNLKTAPSRRIVPIHAALIHLGFDRWVAALRGAGYTQLFPELKHNSEKGYGKSASKWFTEYMARLGIPRDGKKAFHSFRHTYTNAIPADTPSRLSRQLTGHARGRDAHDRTYKKEVEPEAAAVYVNRMHYKLPNIAAFNVEAGLQAVKDALQRKDRGRGAREDLGEK